MKVPLKVGDGLIAFIPDVFLIAKLLGEPFIAEDLGMHLDGQYLLITSTSS
jgi:hypothetical protein